MKIHSVDTYKRLKTKKIRSIDLTVAGVTATGNTILFRPPFNTKYFVKQVITHNRRVAGTVTDAPNIIVDNGTNGSNFVAAVDLSTTEGAVKQHTMASTTLFIDHANPLRLRSMDGADGATSFLVDVVIEMLELTGQ